MFARYWKALSHEPLAHFLALAALLFVAYDLLAPSEREAIVIMQASIDELVRQQEELLARPLTDDERRAVVETTIDDEVLLREAYRRGLDRDAVVRRHLVEKMRFILGEDAPEPTEAEFKAYLAANRERYCAPHGDARPHLLRRPRHRAGGAYGAAGKWREVRRPRRFSVHARQQAAPL